MNKNLWSVVYANSVSLTCNNLNIYCLFDTSLEKKEAHLPNMQAISSGSVSFSSFVRTWRKKRTLDLSNSPNSITYTKKGE